MLKRVFLTFPRNATLLTGSLRWAPPPEDGTGETATYETHYVDLAGAQTGM